MKTSQWIGVYLVVWCFGFLLGWHFSAIDLRSNIMVQGRFHGSEPDGPTIACNGETGKEHYYCAIDRRTW